jgi:hypothetical protein
MQRYNYTTIHLCHRFNSPDNAEQRRLFADCLEGRGITPQPLLTGVGVFP